MLWIYSLLLTIAFIVMSPLFILRRQKYASGFKQRLGNYLEFRHDGRKVIWLHAVSVGEANAARPLVDKLLEAFPDHRIVVSATTKTGQELAQKIFTGKADAVFYFPFDWKFSVRRALENYQPSLVLLMETEIWPRFIREAKRGGAKVVIVNGRLSERSFRRYSHVRGFVASVLGDVDFALMQNERDAERIRQLGIDPKLIAVTGNLKFDQQVDEHESGLTKYFRERFGFDGSRPLIVVASTHHPEERRVLEPILNNRVKHRPRTVFAPRHPERFDLVADILSDSGFTFARRSAPENNHDRDAEIILLDSIGELRAIYPLADIVFIGGSLIPHGGQSVLEPAAAGKAIVTGPHTENFDAVVREFLRHDALVQIPEFTLDDFESSLTRAFSELLSDPNKRAELGRNAGSVILANRGACERTVALLRASFEK